MPWYPLGPSRKASWRWDFAANVDLVPLSVTNSNQIGSDPKLCVTEACSVGDRVSAGLWNINNFEQRPQLWFYRPMEHGRQPEVAYTAVDSKDLLCSKWSMYIVWSCQKPNGPLAFTIERNVPALVIKWHDKAYLTAMAKAENTVGTGELCGTWLMSLEQEKNASACWLGGPDWLESDKNVWLWKLC